MVSCRYNYLGSCLHEPKDERKYEMRNMKTMDKLVET